MSYDVFLSWSPVDRLLAQRIHRALDKAGIVTWIHADDCSVDAAITAIGMSRMMVLVFSDHSNICPRVRREAERAVSHNLTIVPFRVADVPLSRSMEYFISSTHWFDALDGPPELHLERLSDVVCRLLLSIEATAREREEALFVLEPATLKRLELNLAQAIGPVAKVFVGQSGGKARNVGELANRLSRLIEHPDERKAFINRCREDGFLPALPQIEAPAPVVNRDWLGRKKHEQTASGETEDTTLKMPWSQRPIDEQVVETATRQLAYFVGPIARILVQRSARQAVDAGDLALLLAEHLHSDAERAQFLQTLRKQ